MKKLVLLLSILVMTFTLTACGNTSEPVNSNSPQNQGQQGSDSPTKKDVADDFIKYVTDMVSYLTDDGVVVSDQSLTFIKNNKAMFINQTDESINKAKNQAQTLDVRELNKNITPFLNKMAAFTGYVIQISEETVSDDMTMTQVLLLDEVGNTFEVLLFDSAVGIYEDDVVTFYGLPLGSYSYENLGGGHTIALYFLGSTIEKVE